MRWIDVRSSSENGRLWFRLNPERGLIEIKSGRVLELVDLHKYGLHYDCRSVDPVPTDDDDAGATDDQVKE